MKFLFSLLLILIGFNFLCAQSIKKEASIYGYISDVNDSVINIKLLVIPNKEILISSMPGLCGNCDNPECDFSFLFYKYDSLRNKFILQECKAGDLHSVGIADVL